MAFPEQWLRRGCWHVCVQLSFDLAASPCCTVILTGNRAGCFDVHVRFQVSHLILDAHYFSWADWDRSAVKGRLTARYLIELGA